MTKTEEVTMYIKSLRADLMERDEITRARHHRAALIGLHPPARAPRRRR